MNQEKLVSVIIPTYNSAKYLYESIYSIVNQSYKNIEIIIVDDTPTDDGTKGILDSFEDKRIVYVKPTTRLGMVKSLNYAISISHGEYIARMDADDISHLDRIRIQVDYLDKNPYIGLVGCNCYTIDEKNRITGSIIHPSESDDIKSKMMFNVALIHPAVMIRRELLVNDPYNEVCFCCEDYELWSRLIGKTEFHNLEQKLLKYRILSNSAMQSQLKKLREDQEYYRKHTAILKLAYDNVLKYFDADDVLPANYVDMLFAKKIDDIPIRDREIFLSVCEKIIRRKNNSDYVSCCVGYQWLKMTKNKFWNTKQPRLLFYSVGQVFSLIFMKIRVKVFDIISKNKLNDWTIS